MAIFTTVSESMATFTTVYESMAFTNVFWIERAAFTIASESTTSTIAPWIDNINPYPVNRQHQSLSPESTKSTIPPESTASTWIESTHCCLWIDKEIFTQPLRSCASLHALVWFPQLYKELFRPSRTTSLLQNILTASGHQSPSLIHFFKAHQHSRAWRIPAGTPVGMTTMLMHEDKSLYPEPKRFKPERWMEIEARRKAEKTYAPFSRGTRVCLGMK